MVDSTPLIPDSSIKDDKQGHRILGCCDSRRAVITINSIALALSFVGLLFVLNSDSSNWVIISSCINCVFYFVVLGNVLIFRYGVVIVAILWDVTIFILMIVSLIIGWRYDMNGIFRDTFKSYGVLVIIFTVHKIFAECAFVYEVRKGTMSRETYSMVKYSW